MDNEKVLYWEMILGTEGGVNRAMIIKHLKEAPLNINQIAEKLNVNYRTISHHVKILEENGLLASTKGKYNKMYFLSDELQNNYDEFINSSLKSFLDD
jgi:DNA-binding transcriptional ArsR family regulator